jgi:hypothetical protein
MGKVRSSLLWPDDKGQHRFAAYIDEVGKLFFGAYQKDAFMPKKLNIHKERSQEAVERLQRLKGELVRDGFKPEWFAPPHTRRRRAGRRRHRAHGWRSPKG